MNKIVINQTLHGYDQGHSLLKSSTQISTDAKRNLMIMSDMSGSSMLSGFEEYITGYPIKELNMYALAKTWNAPEMKRPGCVWTQTLLINFSDLYILEKISNLLQLFIRPSENLDIDYYSRPIDFNILGNLDSTINISGNNIDPTFTKEIIFQLYSTNNSILIQSHDALEYESIILSIWTQQWPRLKRNFSFCTGAISARTLNNKLLDIQIVPFKTDRIIMDNDNVTILNPDVNLNVSKANWVDFIYDDLHSGSIKLSTFFKTYGADVREERGALVSLVELFIYLNREKQVSVSEVIKTLSEHFPLPTDAFTLKKNILFNQNKIQFSAFSFYNEESVLFELATTEFYDSFDFKNLEFAERFQILFKNNHKSVLDILDQLISSNINPNGEIVLKAIAQVISERELELLNQNYRKLLLIFIFFNPELACNSRFWKVSISEQNENFSTLLKTTNVNWQNVIGCLLKIDARIDKEIIYYANIGIASNILNWVNSSESESDNLSYYWLDILKERPNEILEWISVNAISKNLLFQLIPQILNPNSQLIANSDINIWLKLISSDNLSLNYDDKIRFKSFILALSFNIANSNIIHLLSYSFEDVYKAALASHLDYNSWKILEVHTKALSYWKDWDKCKKLRNALIDKFIELKWPVNHLYKIFSDKKILFEMFLKFEKSNGK